jgi:ACS family hexuronate transporter-like MFS transporter
VPWRNLLGRPEVRRLLAARFCFDPVFYFYMFWIPQYLSRERGMSLTQIGALMWIPFVALEVANIGAGQLSDTLVNRGWNRRRARMTLMLIAALLTPASFGASLAETPALAIGLMAVLMFAHGIWITNFMTLVGETVASDEIATTVGLTGMCGGIAGMLSNLVIGPVVDKYSFGPIFLASAVVYPVAWLILRSGRRPAAA